MSDIEEMKVIRKEDMKKKKKTNKDKKDKEILPPVTWPEVSKVRFIFSLRLFQETTN